MRHAAIASIVVAGIAAVAGCRNTPSTNAGPEPKVTHGDSDDVRDLATAVQTAPDAVAEAAALRKLQRYAAKERYTYTVNTYLVSSGERVRSATVSTAPIRVEMSIYRADQPVHTFSFIPRDNRNIEIIAKGD